MIVHVVILVSYDEPLSEFTECFPFHYSLSFLFTECFPFYRLVPKLSTPSMLGQRSSSMVLSILYLRMMT